MISLRRERDEGASAVEYALIVSVIAAVIVVVVVALGGVMQSSYSSSCTSIGHEMQSDTSKCK